MSSGFTPTLFASGVLGSARAGFMTEVSHALYLDNPWPLPERVALLCAALGAGDAIHATGIGLLGQEGDLVPVGEVWAGMRRDPVRSRLLAVTAALGRGDVVPLPALRAVHEGLGAWVEPWQDILSFAALSSAVFRANESRCLPHPDPRMDAWLATLLRAGVPGQPTTPARATRTSPGPVAAQ